MVVATRPGVCSLLPTLDPLAASGSGGGPVGFGKFSLKLEVELPSAAMPASTPGKLITAFNITNTAGAPIFRTELSLEHSGTWPRVSAGIHTIPGFNLAPSPIPS
jgi:hypothetical protein